MVTPAPVVWGLGTEGGTSSLTAQPVFLRLDMTRNRTDWPFNAAAVTGELVATESVWADAVSPRASWGMEGLS